ncbi:MAG TPA: hypothetical protein VF120_18595 [Ktedonobacterales bacterium]
MTTDEQMRTTKGKRVRLTLEITPELNQRIQRAASEHNQTVQGYAEEMLEQVVPMTNEHSGEQRGRISQTAYEQLVAFRERLAREYPGKIFPDSVEEIRKMREERTRHLESLIHLENESVAWWSIRTWH